MKQFFIGSVAAATLLFGAVAAQAMSIIHVSGGETGTVNLDYGPLSPDGSGQILDASGFFLSPDGGGGFVKETVTGVMPILLGQIDNLLYRRGFAGAPLAIFDFQGVGFTYTTTGGGSGINALFATSSTGYGYVDTGTWLGGDVTITAVPEPASWATMLLGFGILGACLRRRREVLANA